MEPEKKTKEYFEKLTSMKLSLSARARMEEKLLEYARFHSVRAEDTSRSIERVPQRTSFITRLSNLKLTRMTAVLLIALLLGGSTSYAAQSSVPGDFLYPIKVEVNEHVRSALAVGSNAEARLQAELVRERLEEAEMLAARGALDAHASEELRTRIKTHQEKADTNADDSDEGGTVHAELEGTFRTYASILGRLNSAVNGNSGEVLLTDIEGLVNTNVDAQATATARVSNETRPDMDPLINRAKAMLASLKSKLSRAEDDISAETYARISAHLENAIEAEAEAEAEFSEGLYRDAYATLQKVFRIASEVESMLESALRLRSETRIELNEALDNVIRLDVRQEIRGAHDSKVERRSVSTTSSSGKSSIDIELKSETNTNTSVHSNDDDADIEVETDASIEVKTGGISL